MKRKKELLLVFFLVFSLFLVISSAFVIENASYKIKGVISGGGGNITGAYNLKLSIGQPVIGITNINYKICFGFFCLSVPIEIGENSMNFTGRLNYSTGEPVNDSLVRITIKNTTIGLDETREDKTDSEGKFFIKIEPLSSQMMTSNFNVSIRVFGEVEAIYECYYDKDTGDCT